MKVTVQSIHFDADQKLLDFIQKKANKLDLYYDKIISGEVYLKVENVEDEANKKAEIKINLPGTQLFAKHQCKTFEECIDMALEGLRKQISKYKQKQSADIEAAKKVDVALLDEDEY
ncbi:ribosome hibernation-promoting factor, HPF/YfiA family [Mucilaginibacter sp.]